MDETDRSSNISARSFSKDERLCNKRHIEELFKKGSSHFLFPFKVLVLDCDPKPECRPQVLISVPKRTFKRAVHRNKIKRRIKEAYRINRSGIFFDKYQNGRPCYLAIVYVAKEILPYKIIEEKLISILQRLQNT